MMTEITQTRNMKVALSIEGQLRQFTIELCTKELNNLPTTTRKTSIF